MLAEAATPGTVARRSGSGVVVFYPRSADLRHELVPNVHREQPRFRLRAQSNRNPFLGAHAQKRTNETQHQRPTALLLRVHSIKYARAGSYVTAVRRRLRSSLDFMVLHGRYRQTRWMRLDPANDDRGPSQRAQQSGAPHVTARRELLEALQEGVLGHTTRTWGFRDRWSSSGMSGSLPGHGCETVKPRRTGRQSFRV